MPTPQRRITTVYDLASELHSGRYKLYTWEVASIHHTLRDSPLPNLLPVSAAIRRQCMLAQCRMGSCVLSKRSFYQALRAHTARANPPLFIEENCTLKCQTEMIADHFLVRAELIESSARAFAATQCNLVYDAIDFDGMVNDVVKS